MLRYHWLYEDLNVNLPHVFFCDTTISTSMWEHLSLVTCKHLVSCSLTLLQNLPPVPQIPFMMQGYRRDVSHGAAWCCYADLTFKTYNTVCLSNIFQETKIGIKHPFVKHAFPKTFLWEISCWFKGYPFYLWRLWKVLGANLANLAGHHLWKPLPRWDSTALGAKSQTTFSHW